MIDQFLSYSAAVLGRSDRTCQEYGKELHYFAAWLTDALCASDALLVATRADVDSYIAHCLAKGNSESTRARKISAIRSFYRYALEQGALSVNPIATMPRPRIPMSVPRFLSLSDAKTLIRSVRSKPDLFYRRRNTLAIVLLLSTGLRLSELAGIQLVDIYDETIWIRGKGKRERFIALNASCLRALRLWLGKRQSGTNALLVSKQGHPLSPSALATMIKNELAFAGLGDRRAWNRRGVWDCHSTLGRTWPLESLN